MSLYGSAYFGSVQPRIAVYIRGMLLKLFTNYSLPRWLVFASDMVFLLLIFLLTYLLRYNFRISDFDPAKAVQQGLIVVSVYGFWELILRSYAGLIRHTTIIDLFNVLLSAGISAFFLVSFTILSRNSILPDLLDIPLSIILIHFVTATLFLFLIRILIKLFFQLSCSNGTKKNVLIYGAGDLGVIVKRIIDSDIRGIFRIYAFIDGKRALQGKKLNGIPVFAPDALTHEFISRSRAKVLVLALKETTPAEKSKILMRAVDLGLEVLESPPVDSWMNGQMNVKQLRKVDPADLLGRDPISLDLELIARGLEGKTILVTGAAGSIGSEIVRQLARFRPGEVILVDQAETPMFHIGNELKSFNRSLNFRLILADVTNAAKMEKIFADHRPSVVFHAAAYKHVPLLEENVHEAIRVNAGGTNIIADLAISHGAGKFVLISTDKAVRPANIMGATKRLCEIIVREKSIIQGETQFVITRFGNVLGSNGSVIHEFYRQIEQGGPVRVTHPEITRFFMTIPEACQLVLQAGFMGKGGEIYVFDMGEQVKIVDLANNMIRLSGFEPGREIQLEFTGLRPGEKLYEELLYEEEKVLPTYNPKIRIAAPENGVTVINPSQIMDRLNNLYSYTEAQLKSFLFDEVLKENGDHCRY